jgi:branched-chain amino acid transport system permease protein
MPSLTRVMQALVDGLMIGSLYALVAVSFSILWASVRTVNLGLLQVSAMGGVVAYSLSANGTVIALFGGVLAAGAAGLIVHLVAIRPFLKKWALLPIVASLGAGLLVRGAVIFFFGEEPKRMPQLLPTGVWEISGVFIRRTGTIVLVVALIFVLLALYLTAKSRVGLAFRASSWNSDIARAYGINIERVRLGSAFAAAISIGLVGVLTGVLAGSVHPYLGEANGLKGLVAMLLGGAGNLPGALLAGLLVGMLESGAGMFVSSAMKNVVSFGLLFFVMIVKPSGLLKER